MPDFCEGWNENNNNYKNTINILESTCTCTGTYWTHTVEYYSSALGTVEYYSSALGTVEYYSSAIGTVEYYSSAIGTVEYYSSALNWYCCN